MNILLVEDDHECRMILAKLLRDLGHEAEECENGYDALKMFQAGEYNLVLSDIKMPEMTGLEMLKALSALVLKNDFEVVLFTAYSEIQLAIEALRAGAFDFLLKPLRITDLERVIRRVDKKLSQYKQKRQTKILIVGNFLARAGLKAIIHSHEVFRVVGEAAGEEECILEIARTLPDIVVISCKGREQRTLNFCSIIKAKYPAIKVALIAGEGSGEEAQQSLKYGVSAYILNSFPKREDLFYPLQVVSEGGSFIDPAVHNKLGAGQPKCAANSLLTMLSQQELRVLYGLAEGKTNQQLADEMFLSNSTIRNYICNILRKLNLPNRTAAIAYALKNISVYN